MRNFYSLYASQVCFAKFVHGFSVCDLNARIWKISMVHAIGKCNFSLYLCSEKIGSTVIEIYIKLLYISSFVSSAYKIININF